MRVLLINPGYPIAETPSPPLGPAYLAAALEKAGAEVAVLDFAVRPYSDKSLEETLSDFRPQVVGVTCVSMNAADALRIVTTAKEVRPEALTVLGGPHASFRAEETLRENAALDVVVIGEGEATLVELARSAANGGRPHAVRGIVYRDGDTVRQTLSRPPLEFNALPRPARHLLPLGRYRALGLPLTVTTSRGCPFHCIFCAGRKMNGAAVRYRHPHLVVDELAELAGYGFRQINLADDLFTSNPTHCLAVCNGILDRKLELRWTAFARVDTVTSEILNRMRAAGCTAVSFGVESGSPSILKTIRKGITRAQVIEAVRRCRKAGIIPCASFILGLPGETPETLKTTQAFARQLKDMGAVYGFHLLAPFPGTEIRQNHRRYGIRILSDDWSHYHANRAVTETATVSKDMLDRVAEQWERQYLEYLAGIRKRVEAGELDTPEALEYRNLERISVTYDLMMTAAVEKYRPSASASQPSDTSLLTALAASVKKFVDHPAQRIYAALEAAIQCGHLEKVQTGLEERWRWVERLS